MDFPTIRDQLTSKCMEILNEDEIKTQDIIFLAKWFRDLERTTITPSNVKDFVVLIINFFINLHKFSELKNCKSHFLSTVRVACGTILHVIEALNIHSLVIKRSSRIVKLITTNYGRSVCAKELLKVLNVCLSKATSQVIEETADKHKMAVCNLYNLIEDTSDVELQFVVLEAVLRFFHTERLKRILHQLGPKNEKLKTILENDDSDLYGTIRSYINELNKNSSCIFSIKCDSISLESAVIERSSTTNLPIKEAWLDFDLRERRISFFCNKECLRNLPNKLTFPTLTEWEVVSFFAEDKIKIDFIYCDGAFIGTIKLMIKLNTRNINLFNDTQSEMVKTLIIATSVDSPESDKFTAEILPEMFPDSFNLDANSQVSSYRALCTPLRDSETPDLILDRVTSPELRFERDKFLKVRTDEELERSTQKRPDQQNDDYFSLTQCHLSNDYNSDDCIIVEEDAEVGFSQDLRRMFRNSDKVTKRMSRGPHIDITDLRNSSPEKLDLSNRCDAMNDSFPDDRSVCEIFRNVKENVGKLSKSINSLVMNKSISPMVKLSRINRSDAVNDTVHDDQSVHEIIQKAKENDPKLSKRINVVVMNKSISPMSFARSAKSPAVLDILTEETEYREVNMQLKKKAFTKLSKGNPMFLTSYSQSSKQASQPSKEHSTGLLTEESFVKSSEEVGVLSHTKVEKWLSHSGDASKYSDLLTEEPELQDEEPIEVLDFVCEEPHRTLDRSPRSQEEFKQNDFEEVAVQIDPTLKENSNKNVEVSECLLDENRECQASNRNVTPKMSKNRDELEIPICHDFTNVEDKENYSWSELSEADDDSSHSYRCTRTKKKCSRNKRNKAKTNKTRKLLKIKPTSKSTKNMNAKRDVITGCDTMTRNVSISPENVCKMSNCIVMLQDVLAEKKNRSSGFNCLPLEARKRAEEIRQLNERSMASIASSKNSSEKIVLSGVKSVNNDEKPQSPEKVTYNRKPTTAKNKRNIQDGPPRKSYGGEDGCAIGLVTKTDISYSKKVTKNQNLDDQGNKVNANLAPNVSSSCDDIILNTEKIGKQKVASPSKVTERRRCTPNKRNQNKRFCQKTQKFNNFTLDSESSDDAPKIMNTERVENEGNTPRNSSKRTKQFDVAKTLKNEANSENAKGSPSIRNAVDPSSIAENSKLSKLSIQDSVLSFHQAEKDPPPMCASLTHGINDQQNNVQCEDISTRDDRLVMKKSPTLVALRNSPTGKIIDKKSIRSENSMEINRQDSNRSSSDVTKDRVDSTMQSIFKGLSDSETDVDMQPLKPIRTNELIDVLDSESNVDMQPLKSMRTNELINVLETQISQRVVVEEAPKKASPGLDSTVQDIFKGLSDSGDDLDMRPLEPLRTNELLDVVETHISQQGGVKEVPAAISLSDDDSFIVEPTPTSSNQKVPGSVSETKSSKTLKHVMSLPQSSQHKPTTKGDISHSLTKSSPNTSSTTECRNNRKDILDSSQLKIGETPKHAGTAKRNTRKLFDADDMSYLDECFAQTRDAEIWEAKIKEQEQVVPISTQKKKTTAKRQIGTSKKRMPKTREIVKGNSKKRTLVPVFGQTADRTDVSLARTQEQIIRLRQMVQEKKKDSEKKRKIKKEEDSDSDVSVESRNKSKKPKINIISNVVLKPLEENGREHTQNLVFGRQQFKEFHIENLVNALSFATGRDMRKTNLRKEVLNVVDKYL